MRTFAIITTDANELVAEIHDRMPLISHPPTRGTRTVPNHKTIARYTGW